MFVFYVPFPSKETAQELAKNAVTQGFARCANILAPVESFYMYGEPGTEETLCCDQEIPVIFKVELTQKDAFEAFMEQAHPYDIPAIICFAVSANKSFEEWIQGH